MIKKLKRKLIAIAMLSVVIVIGTILITSYSASMFKLTITTDKIIKIIAENGGQFPETNNIFDLETIARTRFFTKKDFKNSSILDEYDITRNFIEIEEAKEIAKKASHKIFNRGYIQGYRYYKTNTEYGKLYIFIDCNNTILSIHFLLSAAILVSSFGLLTVFALLGLFSFKILHPIAEAYEKQKKFITNASHELKTPLTVITANTELLEMEYGENEYTETITRQVKKLTGMTNTLVSLSKIDEMTMLDDMTLFSLTEVAYDYALEFEKVLDKEFNYQIDDNLSYRGNERLIRNLFSILLDNSRKYSISFVNLKVEKIKNKIHIICENDSENISKGDLDFFTERFFRKDESRVLEGSGIGLSLAKEITHIHKGNIKIFSPDGKICVVHITI